MGGTMRLGLRPTVFDRGSETWSKARKLYGGAEKMWERHRHRYEVNPEQVQRLLESGLPFVGKDEKGERMQILELKGIVNVPSISEKAVSNHHSRSPIFHGFPGSSRTVLQATQSFTALLRLHCSILWTI